MSLSYRTSFYLNGIDLDYDAALDNLNVDEIVASKVNKDTLVAGNGITVNFSLPNRYTIINESSDSTTIISGAGIAVSQNGNAFTVSNTAKDSLSRYSAYSNGNNNIEVLATTVGITATLVGTQITFTIPVGTRIISAKIRVENFSSLIFIFGTNDMANSSMANRWMPFVQAWREDTGQQLTGITSIMDLSNFTKVTVNGLINATKCQVRIVF
jgi:hypothetical protein